MGWFVLSRGHGQHIFTATVFFLSARLFVLYQGNCSKYVQICVKSNSNGIVTRDFKDSVVD